jgi:hypothetical protein
MQLPRHPVRQRCDPGEVSTQRLVAVLTCLVVSGLVIWLVLAPWEQADRVASIASALGTVAAVGVAVWAAVRKPPGERPPTTKPRPEPPRAPRRVVASHVGGVAVAAACFIAANFLPIGSGYFTDKSSGLQTAQVTLTFNLSHPLTRHIATGPDGAKVDVAWWLAPFLGLGTAAMLALALFFPLLLRSLDADLKAMGKRVYAASVVWVSVFAFCLLVAQATNLLNLTGAPGMYERDVPQSGAWMLFAASVILSETLRRTERHLRQPSTTQASQPCSAR